MTDEGRAAELKWLSNKAFQLLSNLDTTATQVVMAHVLALVDCVEPFDGEDSDVRSIQLPFVVPPEMYKEFDDIDCYNALTEYLPILNGLVYSSDEARRGCLLNGGAELVAGLCCRKGLDLDLKVCALYVLANVTSHSRSVPPAVFHSVLRLPALDVIARAVSTHHQHPGPDESPEEHSTHLEEIQLTLLQAASALVLTAGAGVASGPPPRAVVAGERQDLVSLAAEAGTSGSARLRREALSFLLALLEDDAAAAALLHRDGVRGALRRAAEDREQLPLAHLLQVEKHLKACG